MFGSCYLFGIASLFQVLFLQSFLKKGQEIMMAGLMLLFIGSALYYPVRLLGIDKGWSIDAANACFLMPTVAISHLFYEFADYEGRRQQLTTENNPLIQGALYMMAISCVFWGLVAFYFEQMMPQSHGPAFEEPGFIFLDNTGVTSSAGRRRGQDRKFTNVYAGGKNLRWCADP